MTDTDQSNKLVRVLVDFTTGSGITNRRQGIQAMGNVSAADNFSIIKDGATVDSSATVTLKFRALPPAATTVVRTVGGLDITIFDVDRSCGTNGTFTDEILITALNANGVAQSPTTVTLGANVTGLGGGPGGYPRFQGVQDAAGDTNTGGSVRLQFANTVFLASFSVEYISRQATSCNSNPIVCGTGTCTNAASTTQWIGINEFSWC